MAKHKKCRRCGKRWCGTNRRLKKLWPEELWSEYDKTFGSRKCARKGRK